MLYGSSQALHLIRSELCGENPYRFSRGYTYCFRRKAVVFFREENIVASVQLEVFLAHLADIETARLLRSTAAFKHRERNLKVGTYIVHHSRTGAIVLETYHLMVRFRNHVTEFIFFLLAPCDARQRKRGNSKCLYKCFHFSIFCYLLISWSLNELRVVVDFVLG